MSVTRYELKTKYRGNESWDEMEESPDGMYVRYEDYAESQREFRAADATIENLQMQLEKLAAESAEMKEEISNITFMRDDDFFGSTKRAQEVMGRLVNIKTPATDAYMSERGE